MQSRRQPAHRIALLVHGDSQFGREVISGVAHYLRSTRASWDLFLDDDFLAHVGDIESWQGDGIIADFNHPAVSRALAAPRVPVVAIGCSYRDPRHYPSHLPYVASDNQALIAQAYDHLIAAGLQQFALISLPPDPAHRWATERELAFEALMQRDGLPVHVFRGRSSNAPSWTPAGVELIDWLAALPKPIGIIGVNDARARQLLQACLIAGIAVPEQVALIGIDGDPLARMLTRIPLSSVVQGAQQMGQQAAALLHESLHGRRHGGQQWLVKPQGLVAQTSSRHERPGHPHVVRARYFIRQYACQGIKNEQVADFVGVSRSTLEACFRQELQCSVHDEILRFRLDEAKRLLTHSPLPIAEVAVRCGFRSVQYLHTVFKRELGCTPKSYRQRLPVELLRG